MEAATALLYATAAARFGLGWELCASLLLFSVAVAAAGITLDGHDLPTRLPMVGITGCSAALLAATAAGSPWSAVVRGIAGAGIAAAAVRVLERPTHAATTTLAVLSGLTLGWLGWTHLGLAFLVAGAARRRLPPAAGLALAAVVGSLLPL